MSLKDRLAAFQSAATAPFRKSVPVPVFAEGELVQSNSASSCSSVRGVVVAVMSTTDVGGQNKYVYCVRGAAAPKTAGRASVGGVFAAPPKGAPVVLGRHGWCEESTLTRMVIQEEHGKFQLEQLPAGVLGLVLAHMSTADAAMLATTSRKFLQAFNDATAWKKRCTRQFQGTDLDAAFEASGRKSWKDFFRFELVYHIRIVTVFGHRGGTSLSGDFRVIVAPETSVMEFLRMVKEHPKNRQRGPPQLYGFDPKVIRSRAPQNLADIGDPATPVVMVSAQTRFCKPDWNARTVQEAGLFDGAELAQDENMMRD